MKYCVFVDVFQDSVDLNLTILCNRFFFSMNMEDNAYCEIGPDTLSRASVAQLCVGADPGMFAEEDVVLSSCHSHVVALYSCTGFSRIAKFICGLYHTMVSLQSVFLPESTT